MATTPTLYHRITRNNYRPKDARLVRLTTFLMVLRKRHPCPRKVKVVNDTIKVINKIKRIKQTRLYEVFSKKEIRSAWEWSKTLMVESYEQENTCVAADGGKTCIICMEKVGDYVSVHGGTAHGGVCGTCALRLVMQARPRCPICSQKISMIAARGSICTSKLKIFDP